MKLVALLVAGALPLIGVACSGASAGVDLLYVPDAGDSGIDTGDEPDRVYVPPTDCPTSAQCMSGDPLPCTTPGVICNVNGYVGVSCESDHDGPAFWYCATGIRAGE